MLIPCHGRSCVAVVRLQEIGVVHLCHSRVSCLFIHVNPSSCRDINGEIVCVRYEAMWWCRGIAPFVPNLGTGGEG